MLKYILILYMLTAGTSEQMPEWYDTIDSCIDAGMAAANKDIKFACVPVEY